MIKKYYRRITERLPQSFLDWKIKDVKKVLKSRVARDHVKAYLVLLLSISFVVFFVYTVISYMNLSVMREEWLATRDNFAYWEEVAQKQENSPDAYYQAGFYAAELRDKNKAIAYLEKALQLDPGFEKAKALSQQLAN